MDNTVIPEASKKSSKAIKLSTIFKDKINHLNLDEIIETIKLSIEKVVELEITTCVTEISGQPGDDLEKSPELTNKSSSQMYTRINLIDGEIENIIGSEFIGNGVYAELREFHLNQVKESSQIIKNNIESLQKLYNIFVDMVKSNKSESSNKSQL